MTSSTKIRSNKLKDILQMDNVKCKVILIEGPLDQAKAHWPGMCAKPGNLSASENCFKTFQVLCMFSYKTRQSSQLSP